jgi:hypothetical protein
MLRIPQPGHLSTPLAMTEATYVEAKGGAAHRASSTPLLAVLCRIEQTNLKDFIN